MVARTAGEGGLKGGKKDGDMNLEDHDSTGTNGRSWGEDQIHLLKVKGKIMIGKDAYMQGKGGGENKGKILYWFVARVKKKKRTKS